MWKRERESPLSSLNDLIFRSEVAAKEKEEEEEENDNGPAVAWLTADIKNA